MNRVAVAPITQPDGTIRGALLIGYVLTARDAQMKHDLLGTEVAYFHNGKVHTSSFISEGAGENAKEDGKLTKGELDKLRADEAALRARERVFRESGQGLNSAEYKALERELDRLSKEISRATHNGR